MTAAVAFHPDGERIVTASWDQSIKVWDVATGRELKSRSVHTAPIQSVAISKDGKLVSGGEDKIARVWKADTLDYLFPLEGHEDRIFSVAFSPDGETILTGGWDRTARLWDAKTGTALPTAFRARRSDSRRDLFE